MGLLLQRHIKVHIGVGYTMMLPDEVTLYVEVI